MAQLRRVWSRWTDWKVSIFCVLDGHTTTKKNPWRLRAILLVAAVMASLVILMLYYKSIMVYPLINPASLLPDVSQTFNDYLQIVVELYYINKYDREAFAEYYQKYTIIDKSFNKYPDQEIKVRLAKLIGVFMLIWLTNISVHFATLWYEFYWQYPVIFFPFHLFVFVKILSTLFLSAHVIRVEYRMRMIGDSVEDCCERHGRKNAKVKNEFTAHKQRWLEMQNQQKLTKPNWYYNNKNIAARLSQFYLILTEQIEFINNIHGIRMLLLSLNLTIDMVRFINSMYRYVSGKQYIQTVHKISYTLAGASATRTLICAVMLLSLVHHCERAYRQTERIVRLCDTALFAASNNDGEVRSSLTELRELVLSRPVSFHVARFFRLEYPALTAVAATVVSYSIILLQSS